MQINELGEGFGEWLVKHTKRDDWIGRLAKSSRADPLFRNDSTPNDLRMRLQHSKATGDAFDALDDAELEWLNS